MKNKIAFIALILISSSIFTSFSYAEEQWMVDLRNGNVTEQKVYTWLKRAEKLEKEGKHKLAEEERQFAFDLLEKLGTANKVYEAMGRF